MQSFFSRKASIQSLDLTPFGVKGTLDVLREDALHPFISGNKFRKLKYWALSYQPNIHNGFLSFGGAYSNHLVALAYLGHQFNIPTKAYVRGIETSQNSVSMRICKNLGMELLPISYSEYRKRHDADFLKQCSLNHPGFIIIPEGGKGSKAEQGVAEMVDSRFYDYTHICTAIGTGTTFLGINSALENAKTEVLGFSAVPEKYLDANVKEGSRSLIFRYLMGGYAKINPELVAFIKQFWEAYQMLLDPIYTGKMVFGILEEMRKNQLPAQGVLCIHSGGLQGLLGMPNEFSWAFPHLPQELVSKL